MDIYYKNSSGEVIDFMSDIYHMIADGSALGSYEWNYEESDSGYNHGSRIKRFKRGAAKKNIEIGISADDIQSALDFFLSVTEKDVLTLNPGRLYINNSYLSCYIISADNSSWIPGVNFIRRKVKIVTEYPFWITEQLLTYTGTASEVGKRYPYAYPIRYAANTAGVINNSHYAATDFSLTIFGACNNPEIYIGGHKYALSITLLDGESVTIDSREGTIKKKNIYGTESNVFGCRNKSESVFEKIKPGTGNVQWNGNFSFTITLFQERSEPRWIL